MLNLEPYNKIVKMDFIQKLLQESKNPTRKWGLLEYNHYIWEFIAHKQIGITW